MNSRATNAAAMGVYSSVAGRRLTQPPSPAGSNWPAPLARPAGTIEDMQILRYSAFSTDPRGGNPAGVVLDATGARDDEMLAVAAEVGYSETAFITSRSAQALEVRYFSPLAEVDFCGHATIAMSVAYASRFGTGPLLLHTRAGEIEVLTSGNTATLTSVAPRTAPLEALDSLLKVLRWEQSDLDPSLPPMAAFAGVWHPIIAARTRARLSNLDYDFEGASELMRANGWTTIDLVWRESETVFHARNPFPPGGVVEDPATGAAAAAFGGYLRSLGSYPAELTIHQGEDMGRPSLITVTIPTTGGIAVTGAAVPL